MESSQVSFGSCLIGRSSSPTSTAKPSAKVSYQTQHNETTVVGVEIELSVCGSETRELSRYYLRTGPLPGCAVSGWHLIYFVSCRLQVPSGFKGHSYYPLLRYSTVFLYVRKSSCFTVVVLLISIILESPTIWRTRAELYLQRKESKSPS